MEKWNDLLKAGFPQWKFVENTVSVKHNKVRSACIVQLGSRCSESENLDEDVLKIIFSCAFVYKYIRTRVVKDLQITFLWAKTGSLLVLTPCSRGLSLHTSGISYPNSGLECLRSQGSESCNLNKSPLERLKLKKNLFLLWDFQYLGSWVLRNNVFPDADE